MSEQPRTTTVQDLPQDTSGLVLLDVREDDEWAAGHVAGALHVPRGDLPARLADLPADAELQVLCRAGGRATRAAQWLEQNGYDAVVVEGGMGAWADAGRPMVAEREGVEPTVL